MCGVATLQQVPDLVVSSVESLRVDAVDVAHPTTQVWRRRMDKKMIMFGHQAVGQDIPASSFVLTRKQCKKACAVDIVFEDRFTAVTPRHYVVAAVFHFESKRS